MVADIETSDLSDSVILMKDGLDQLRSAFLIKGEQEGSKGGFFTGVSLRSKSGTSIELFINFLKQTATYQWLLEPNSNITDITKDSFDTFYPIQFCHQSRSIELEHDIIEEDDQLMHFVRERRNYLFELKHQKSAKNAPPQEVQTPKDIQQAPATLTIDQPQQIDHLADTIQSPDHPTNLNMRKTSLAMEVIDHRDRSLSINERPKSEKNQPINHAQQTDRPAKSPLKNVDMDIDVMDNSSSGSGNRIGKQIGNQLDSTQMQNETILDEPQLLPPPRLSGIQGGSNFANDMRLLKSWISGNLRIDNGITSTVNARINIDDLKYWACLAEDEDEAFDAVVKDMISRTPGMDQFTIKANGLEPYRRAVFYLEAMSIMYTYLNSAQELERENPVDIDLNIKKLNQVVSTCNRADGLTDFFSRSSKAALKNLSEKMRKESDKLNQVDIPICSKIKPKVYTSKHFASSLQQSNNLKRSISSIKSKIEIAENQASH